MLNMMYIINMYLQKLTYILIVLNVWELVEMLSLGLKKNWQGFQKANNSLFLLWKARNKHIIHRSKKVSKH